MQRSVLEPIDCYTNPEWPEAPRRALIDLPVSEGFRPVALRGAVSEALPEVIHRVDRLFNKRPSLASDVVLATSV